MKRKDVLIIASALIIIAFIIVSVIYYSINGSNIVGKVQNWFEDKETIYSNGWSTSIVDKIKYDAPIPVGFSYVEGNQKKGIIIKDDATGEKYMWIPSREIEYEKHENILSNKQLGYCEKETKESINRYNGFYVAIDDRSDEEIYQEHIKEISANFEQYYALKKLGYEEYKNKHKELTGEEFEVNSLKSTNVNEKTNLDNKLKTSIIETHTMTKEELINIIEYNEEIGNKISISNFKTLTLSTPTKEATEDVKDKEEEKSTEEDKKDWDKIVSEEKYGVPIPKGFEYAEGTVETGLKIKNSDNLSFIWIPVEKATKDENEDGKRDIYDTATKIEKEFLETAKSIEIDEAELGDYSDTKHSEKDELAEYEELLKSIEKYGGFYISEAELGYDVNGNTTNAYRPMNGWYVSNGDYYRNVKEGNVNKDEQGNITELGKKQQNFKLSYEEALKTSKELYQNSTVASSHLTYGIEFDAAILYLLKKNENVTKEEGFNDSTEIGKYINSEIEKLWFNKFELNGIFGLAGNLGEITQEKDGENIIIRGGNWSVTGQKEPLAGKTALSKKEIEEDIDTLGFRACLYIKSEFDEDANNRLVGNKAEAKEKIRDYIEQIDSEYINTRYSQETKEYEIGYLNDIVKYIDERIDKETSTVAFNKIVQYGKDEINILIEYIDSILKYSEGYTYGDGAIEVNGEYTTVNNACFKIKNDATVKMQKVRWNNGIITDEQGKETSFIDIIKEAQVGIEDIRKRYREESITEYIDNYPTAANAEYTKAIKKMGKAEIGYTEDLADIVNIAIKYQEVIEMAYNFEEQAKEYPTVKDEYLNKIVNEANSVDNIKTIIEDGLNAILEKSNYIEGKIVEFIDEYRKGEDTEYTKVIKTMAKEELKNIKDEEELVEVATKYQHAINITINFEKRAENYEETKNEYLTKIKNEAKNAEDVENIIAEGEKKLEELLKPTSEPTQNGDDDSGNDDVVGTEDNNSGNNYVVENQDGTPESTPVVTEKTGQRLGTYYTIKDYTIRDFRGWTLDKDGANVGYIGTVGFKGTAYGTTKVRNAEGDYFEVKVMTPMELAKKCGFTNQSGDRFFYGKVNNFEDGGHYINIEGTYKFICATTSEIAVSREDAINNTLHMFDNWKKGFSRLPYKEELKWLYEYSGHSKDLVTTYVTEWIESDNEHNVVMTVKTGKVGDNNLHNQYHTVIDLSKDFKHSITKNK